MTSDRIENCKIVVTQYITGQGEIKFSVHASGEVPLSTQIGLLELAKVTIIEKAGEDDE